MGNISQWKVWIFFKIWDKEKDCFNQSSRQDFFGKDWIGLDGDFGASFMVNRTQILGPIVTSLVVGSRWMDWHFAGSWHFGWYWMPSYFGLIYFSSKFFFRKSPNVPKGTLTSIGFELQIIFLSTLNPLSGRKYEHLNCFII